MPTVDWPWDDAIWKMIAGFEAQQDFPMKSSWPSQRIQLHNKSKSPNLGNIQVILHTDHCQKSWLPWFDGLIAASEEYLSLGMIRWLSHSYGS